VAQKDIADTGCSTKRWNKRGKKIRAEMFKEVAEKKERRKAWGVRGLRMVTETTENNQKIFQALQNTKGNKNMISGHP